MVSVYDVGGLIGLALGGMVQNSFSKVSINAAVGSYVVHAGGLVGEISPSYTPITIRKTYATGSIGKNGATISSSAGLVSKVTKSKYQTSCTNSHWNIETTMQNTSAVCPSGGLRTFQMMKQTHYPSWDFVNT